MTACTACFLWASAAPREIEPLLDVLVETFVAFEKKPAQMSVSDSGNSRRTVYNAERLAKAMRSSETHSVHVWSGDESEVDLAMHVRDDPRYARVIDRRHVQLVAPTIAPDDPRLIAFLETMCAAYPVAHGGVIRAATSHHASAEGILIGSNLIEHDAQTRKSFDSMNAPRALHLLRRLYPVTIVGPAIWSTLPPLPAVEPPPVVRDVADCKMITAWPTLVDSHDPQFLLGTRELRRWLWPHTIQNPADEPGAIDHRLKWLELLPW